MPSTDDSARAARRARTLMKKFNPVSVLQQPWFFKYLSEHLPFYAYSAADILACDDAPAEVVERRREGMGRLSRELSTRSPQSAALTRRLADGLSELPFIAAHRVPFPFREYVAEHLPMSAVFKASRDAELQDLDDRWSYDLHGSFGVNVFGYELYKDCVDAGAAAVRELGPVLGSFHPVIADNVQRLREISGLDEVSFHMSGTEAVMQAVRQARYHTGRTHLVRFSGAYHGWWDGVVAPAPRHREGKDIYTLREQDTATLALLRKRKNIACVLVNPLQSMQANIASPTDDMLIDSSRFARYDRERYTRWLTELRRTCDERGIVLIMDEVFLGFRLAYGGAQEYFGVRADLVTYGKTLGGGLPVGVVCGKRELMRRYREDRPLAGSFARGTFSAHPYVMAAMNVFLRRIAAPEIRGSYEAWDGAWSARVRRLNAELEAKQLPVRIEHLSSVWVVLYGVPSRYNWMLQFYLRAAGFVLGPAGTGRLILQHNMSDEVFAEIERHFVQAVQNMHDDGFWYRGAALSDQAIRKRILREVLSKLLASRGLGRRPHAPTQASPLTPSVAPADVVRRPGRQANAEATALNVPSSREA